MISFLKQFLESSTIHGLVYISTENKFARFFWFLVVVIGFSYSGYLIYGAFTNWSESPIKTTIETRPISEIAFPKVTVCPPKETFTDLNYDLMLLENMTMTNETRQEFLEIAQSVFLDSYFENEVLANFSKLEEDNKFYNWYHGHTDVRLPYWHSEYGLAYLIGTSATTGSVKTQYFGDKYDPDKIERKLWYYIHIYPPAHVVNNPNYTLTIEIEKVTMNVSGDSKDKMYVSDGVGYLDPGQNVVVHNFTAPDNSIDIKFERDVADSDVDANRNLPSMPGFRVKWSYNPETIPDSKFIKERKNIKFKR